MSSQMRFVVLAGLSVALILVVALKRDRAPTAPPTSGAQAATASRAAAGGAPPSEAVALPRLVDLGSDTCIPCKAMVPVLEDLRREYAGRLRVDVIDAWKNPDEAAPFKIYAIPTQVFLDPSGRELHRHLGFISKDAILETWRRLGFHFARMEKK